MKITAQHSIAAVMTGALLIVGCTQETRNQFGRTLRNWTGVNGVREIDGGEKLVKRFSIFSTSE